MNCIRHFSRMLLLPMLTLLSGLVDSSFLLSPLPVSARPSASQVRFLKLMTRMLSLRLGCQCERSTWARSALGCQTLAAMGLQLEVKFIYGPLA